LKHTSGRGTLQSDQAGFPKARKLTSRKIRQFQLTIRDFFREKGRSFPWRETFDPYEILVSEIMLQQTQVERVAGKYERFTGLFPDFESLAAAELRHVLGAWQGLGYNRRAVALKRTALRVVTDFAGKLPECLETLRTLPGIGPATAGALMAFAFNKPAVFIETNIRRVFIHSFFAEAGQVKDQDILPLVQATLDADQPRIWYYALMDYGAMLKSTEENPNRKSAHYNRQSRFQGSDRQIRGIIIKIMVDQPVLTLDAIVKTSGKDPERVRTMLDRLMEEGFLVRSGDRVSIATAEDHRAPD
jgi:A/G-specific adenine glycosylase